MAATAPLPTSAADPDLLSRALLPPLAFTLDLSCPLPLATRGPKPQFASEWAFPTAGAECSEPLDVYLKRRYLETIYLGEVLSPITGFLADLARAAAAATDAALDTHIAGHLLSLAQIEERHRKVLRPVILAAISAVETVGNIAAQAQAAGIDPHERDVLATAVDVRVRCRAVAEGERGMSVRDLAEEFERREVLVQLVLLLFYRGRNPTPPKDNSKDKVREKKRRRSEKPAPAPASILTDPETALELFADRIGVWLAVAELGIGIGADKPSVGAKEPKVDERSVSATLKRFWEAALVATFLPREHVYLSTFHLKVFGTPIPPELVPVKKPRKPAVTHRLDVESFPVKMQRTRTDESTRTSTSTSNARASVSELEYRDRDRGGPSRAGSLDPAAARKNSVVRAPSGKELFKNREVGLLRRTSSLMVRNPTLETTPETARPGLLGRKAAGESLRRHESAAQHETQTVARAETLIFATPAKQKPKYAAPHPHAARHPSAQLFAQPTPIREEPSPAEMSQRSQWSQRSQRSYIAETPVAPRRLAAVAETPVGRGRELVYGDDDDGSDEEEAQGGYGYDDFDDYMIPTDGSDDDDDDDEDDDDGPAASNAFTFVPETPRK